MTTTIRPVDRDAWRRLAPAFMDYNYRQLWDFGVACARRLGAHSEHVAIYEGGDVIGLADVRVKRISILPTGIAYINSGPLVRRNDQFEADRLQGVLSALVDEYCSRRKLVLRIQPPLGPSISMDQQKQAFLDIGFTTPNQLRHYRTIVLDISQPLEMIRKQFDRRWRTCLNNAEKRNLVIETGTDDSIFLVFCQLYEELINRKRFDVDLDANFHYQVQRLLNGNEQFLVSIVYENQLPTAGHVSSFLGDTCVWVLGASNDLGLKNGASYLVQWSVIQKAKEKGCRFYDFCGIDPEKNPGGYQFKKKMGGVDITVPGPFELSPSRLKAYLVAGSEHLYRIVRRAFRPRQ